MKTAYEARLLYEEFVRANSPLFESWEADTAAMLEHAFEAMIDANSFGPLEGWPRALSGGALAFKFKNPLKDAIEKAMVAQATTNLGLIAGGRQADPNMPIVADMAVMVQDGMRGNGSPARWLLDLDAVKRQAAAAQAAAAQQGNIVGALQQAGQAADIVHTGADAAAKLQGAFGAPPQAAADQSFAYGPS
jgi:hypothetical protein